MEGVEREDAVGLREDLSDVYQEMAVFWSDAFSGELGYDFEISKLRIKILKLQLKLQVSHSKLRI